MNLVWLAPLLDSKGQLRYFIGGQVNVTETLLDGSELATFQKLLRSKARKEPHQASIESFKRLAEMLNPGELDAAAEYGGRLHFQIREEHLGHRPSVHRGKAKLQNMEDENTQQRQKDRLADEEDERTPYDVLATPELPIQRVYKHVSTSLYNIYEKLTRIVSACSASPIFPHSVHIAISKGTRYTSVSPIRSNRRHASYSR